MTATRDYLRTKLRQVQTVSMAMVSFQQFYREFLLKLFHRRAGTAQSRPDVRPNWSALLGEVPFLNGGLFDQHELERDNNPDIGPSPTQAFERVFDFFDGYRWHLDERPGSGGQRDQPGRAWLHLREVRQPEADGGLLHQGRHYRLHLAQHGHPLPVRRRPRKECPVAFGPDGGVWRLLRDDPDRYIYPAVGHGITWNARAGREPKAPLATRPSTCPTTSPRAST